MDTRTAHPATASGTQPRCPECEVDLLPTGGGRHLYWSCRYCGTTMPRI